jgi:hypothetical protein
MLNVTTLGEAQQHLVMPVETGIQGGMDSCRPLAYPAPKA